MTRNRIANLLQRTLALTVMQATGIITAGQILQMKISESVGLAVVAGLIQLAHSLATSFVTDGKLTDEEVEQAFTKGFKGMTN